MKKVMMGVCVLLVLAITGFAQSLSDAEKPVGSCAAYASAAAAAKGCIIQGNVKSVGVVAIPLVGQAAALADCMKKITGGACSGGCGNQIEGYVVRIEPPSGAIPTVKDIPSAACKSQIIVFNNYIASHKEFYTILTNAMNTGAAVTIGGFEISNGPVLATSVITPPLKQ